jgi:peptide subunit release factor 1 (eRF1)
VAVVKGRADRAAEKTYTSGVPGKTPRRRGSPARRFERLREMTLNDFYKTCGGEKLTSSSYNTLKIKGVIVCWAPGPTKDIFFCREITCTTHYVTKIHVV